jgi:NAD(P)-dependent dehydrogenase (short-subunit alcohol dehydrogenase family)
MGQSKDQVVVVTGATRGIGRATALAYAREGAKVAICGRSTAEKPNKYMPGTLEEAEAALHAAGAADVLTTPANLGDEADVERFAEAILARFGRCDVLINNAAVSFIGGFLDVPASRWRAVLNVNIMAAIIMTQRLLPGMLERGSGALLTVGSGAAFSDGVPQLPYSVTKLSLERIATGLATQYLGQGIASNCLRIDDVVVTEAVRLQAPQLADRGKWSPDDVARAIVWITDQGVALSGRVLAFEELESLGALKALPAAQPA